MTKSQLADIVERATRASVEEVIARRTDVFAEEMMNELLRDPQFRARMVTLLSAAFEQAIAELQQPTEAKDSDP